MKIAFVSQPIDTVLPPYQNSVGACTYGAACSLAQSHQVTVYGPQGEPNAPAVDLVRQGVRFKLLLPTRSDLSLFGLRNKISKVVRLSAPISTSRWFFPDYGRHVAVELAKENYDIIHVQHCSQYLPLIRKLNPKAKIDLQLHAEWFSQNNPGRLVKRLEGLDLLTTVSNHITDKTKRDLPSLSTPCETVYNGINVEEFSAEKNYFSTTGSRPKRIMYAGGISPHKGIHVLIEAFRIVTQSYPNVELDIIGPHGSYPIEETFDLSDSDWIRDIEGFYRNDVFASIKKKLSRSSSPDDPYLFHLQSMISSDLSKKVRILGLIPRPELVRHYFDADVFVFPPIWDEGFGIPPVEAMAAGTAVVASRSGAVSETVVHGETGLLVEKKDSHGLAQAILTLLENDSLRERMGRAGKRRAMANFTWAHAASAMARRYQALCSNPWPGGTTSEDTSESPSRNTVGGLLRSSAN